MFKFCGSLFLSLTSLEQITIGQNGRVGNNSFRSSRCLFSEVILRCIRIKELLEQKLRGNTLQSSKRQGAKFEYITSVVLSSNLSSLLLILELLAYQVRLIEGKATFETAQQFVFTRAFIEEISGDSAKV